jgi:glucose/arabinose dehydrogenase
MRTHHARNATLAAFTTAAALIFTAHAQVPRAQLFADNLEAPVAVAFAPGDASRVFVLGRFGKISIHDTTTGVQRPQLFIDLFPLVCCHGNANMVGLTFDPNYSTNGFFYVHYQGLINESVVARFHVTANPDIADPNSATIIHKAPRIRFGHNGGAIEFSPVDGFLYIPTGDGGNGATADPLNEAQSLSSPLGKILRINPNVDAFPADPNKHYSIPANNPFLSTPGALPELWAVGLRNPYQSTFDRANGDYYIADVGQDALEEIDIQPAASTGGQNYGWRCREGNACSPYGGCTCTAGGFAEPIYVYEHTLGCSISGGRVYRGSAFPDLQGWFIYSDYCSGFVHAIKRVGNTTQFQDLSSTLAPSPGQLGITSIGDDAAGELYLTDIGTGRVYKIVSACRADLDNGSGTGTFDNAVDINDLLYFLVKFEAGDAAIDLDNGSGTGTPDGGVDINDLLYFLVRFEAGC